MAGRIRVNPEALNREAWRNGARIVTQGIDAIVVRNWDYDGALWQAQMDDDSPVEGWPDGLF